ncbi:MAG: hypothetical protein ABJN39_09470 [Sulfitobacter sp.]|uniref:hypothetical protein n=1 Tax=Alphaproteobacteria TaxID=28211 RepID=UPI00294299B8|nr:hypothetical protein [Sulfitobacter sp. LC.270.F.C4]WOI13533.1 hypothetical protein R1T45_01870 [Sulfitobacter sp. LC.270.F.C4]
MSYVEVLSEGCPKARKHHQCFHCYRSIAPGTKHRKSTLKYDGVYTLRMHLDCDALWDRYMKDNGLSHWRDFPDGSPPLADEFVDSGEFRHLCNAYRGFFPHVVARLEFSSKREATQ